MKKALTLILFLPYVLFVCISLLIIWGLNKKNADNFIDNSVEFMKLNLPLLFITCSGIWFYLITNIL